MASQVTDTQGSSQGDSGGQGELREIKFRQLNMHRAHAAAAILQSKVENNPAICMITEPCTAFNKVSQVPPNHCSVPCTTLTERPRAAIFFPKDIPHVHLEQLSNNDCAVALLQTKQNKILLASIYLDYNGPVVPDWLNKLMAYCDRRKLPSILSFDCNAHSQLFGPETNDRGKIFEEFILQNNLMVENRGDTPTFHAFRRGQNIDTFIDVTLSKNMIPLQDWRVHDLSFNGSDHHTITWSVPLLLNKRPLIRPWHKADWKVFTNHIDAYDFHVPETPERLTNYSVAGTRWLMKVLTKRAL